MARSRMKPLWTVGLVLAGAFAVGIPATAVASCTPPAGELAGFLLEITESPPLHAAPGGPTSPGAFSPGIGRQLDAVIARLAQATAVGAAEGCGSLADLGPNVEFHARTRIPFAPAGPGGPLVPEPGTLTGSFKIDAGPKGSVPGKVAGIISFLSDPACGGVCPIAFVSGAWSTLGNDRRSGQFTAFAFVPIPLGCTLDTTSPLGTGCFYLIGGALVPLDPATEYSKQFGTGVAKFLFTFTTP